MFSAGEQIGGYTIVHLLGRGGMGEVYLAQHRRVARRAAIKVLIPELSQNAVVLDRFFNEARAASLIRHPGIVDILDCDIYDGQAYIVMEFLDGEALGGYLFRTGPLERDLPFFLGISVAIAGAVGAAHATGIIHRDLKPDNIYLHLAPNSGAVTVKILDFGIAKLALQDGAPSQTNTGVLLGTPTYMSPEQCRGAGRVDSRSDIYSLGCILYECACGFPPFVRDGMGDLIVAHVSEAPVPPIEHVPSLPADVNDLILRMLAKNAGERPQTMDDVVAALRACAQALGVDADAALRPRIPVEKSPAIIEPAATQPAPPAGPSGVETARLRPASRPVPVSDAVPQMAPRSSSARSGRASGDPGARAGFSRPTTDDAATPRKTTTLSSTAGEAVAVAGRPPSRAGKWVAVAGALAVVTVGGLFMLARPKQTEAPRPPTAAAPVPAAPLAPPAPSPPVTREPSHAASPPEEKAPPAAPPSADVADTVRIDVDGVPPGTTAQVDGTRAQLPIDLPRGPGVHRLVLRAPGQSSRVIELDGTRDRIVDFAAIAKAPPPASRERPTERDGASPHSGAGSSSRGKKAAPASSSDRDALIDL